MSWLALSLAAALCEASRDVVIKKQAARLDPYVVAALTRLFAGVLLALFAVVVTRRLPALGGTFWLALAAGAALNALAMVLYVRALHLSDLSLVAPVVTLTPAFLLVIGPLLLGELPNAAGVAGIALIVAGSYVVRLPDRARGVLGPFRALLTDPGARLMLIVAVIYAVTSSLDKIGVRASSPTVWAACVNGSVALLLLPVAVLRARAAGTPLRGAALGLLPAGVFASAGGAAQMTAVSMTLVAYVISLKRLSSAFAVLGGRLFFGETGLRHRLVGATLMVAGVACIALLGAP